MLEKDEEDRDDDGCLDGLAEDEEEDGDGEELHVGLGCLSSGLQQAETGGWLGPLKGKKRSGWRKILEVVVMEATD